MSEQTIAIVDRGTGELVEAKLLDELDATVLIEVEKVWGPYRNEAVRRLIKVGTPPEKQPQHWHWDWSKKAGRLSLLAYRGVGIFPAGRTSPP